MARIKNFRIICPWARDGVQKMGVRNSTITAVIFIQILPNKSWIEYSVSDLRPDFVYIELKCE